MILPLQLVLSDVAVKKYSFLGSFWFKTTNEGQRNRVVIFCKERRKIECVNEPSRLEAIKTIFTRNKRFLEPRLLPKQILQGRGGGQVVSVLSFYSDIMSSNPAEAYIFSVECGLNIQKYTKRGRGWSM